jgi:hypothetical protein
MIMITHHVALKIILNLSIDNGEAIMSKGYEQQAA